MTHITPKRGQLSEYQYQYLNTNVNSKRDSRSSKIKDNLDIFSLNGKAHDFRSESSTSFEPQIRSKVLDRLNRLMPNNPNVSWYKAENNFFGHDDVYKKNTRNTKPHIFFQISFKPLLIKNYYLY